MSFLFIELSIGANLGKASINDDSVFSTKWPQAMGRTGTAQLIANHCLFSLPGLNTVSMLKKISLFPGIASRWDAELRF